MYVSFACYVCLVFVCFRRVFLSDEKILGSYHALVAEDVVNLAEVMSAQVSCKGERVAPHFFWGSLGMFAPWCVILSPPYFSFSSLVSQPGADSSLVTEEGKSRKRKKISFPLEQ